MSRATLPSVTSELDAASVANELRWRDDRQCRRQMGVLVSLGYVCSQVDSMPTGRE